jgi:hypothetical protein
VDRAPLIRSAVAGFRPLSRWILDAISCDVSPYIRSAIRGAQMYENTLRKASGAGAYLNLFPYPMTHSDDAFWMAVGIRISFGKQQPRNSGLAWGLPL